MRSSSLRTTGTLAVLLVVGLVAPHPVSVGPAPAAASVGSPSGAALAPGWVDTSSREAVLAAWAVSDAVEVAPVWARTTTGCEVESSTSATYRNATIGRVNHYRALLGVEPVTNDPALNPRATAAARWMALVGSLTHFPAPPDAGTPAWARACWSDDVATGAAEGSLALGATGPRAIDLYMVDPGDQNGAVGHRRNQIDPKLATVGTGDAHRPATRRLANSMVFGANRSATTPVREADGLLAWPTRGHNLASRIPARWHTSLAIAVGRADYTSATVVVKQGSRTVTLATEPCPTFDDSGFPVGTPTNRRACPYPGSDEYPAALVFTPELPTLADGEQVTVTVSGVKVTSAVGATTTRTISYDVIGAAPSPVPFSSWPDLVTRQFQDLTGVTPGLADLTELYAWTTALANSTKTKGQLVDELRRSAENLANVDPVTRVYRAFLRRAPDAGGLQYWIRRKRAQSPARTWNVTQIATYFTSSNEFRTKYGSLTNRHFATQIYTDVLGRATDPSGVDYWTRQLDGRKKTRAQVMVGFSESSEYRTKQAENTDVTVAYAALLGRTPTTAEAVDWTTRQKSGTSHVTLVTELLDSPAYTHRITG